MEWSGGREWDNCNSIINKKIYYKKITVNFQPKNHVRKK